MGKISITWALFFFIFAGRATAEVVDKVVAVVNDDVITQRELDIELAPILGQYIAAYQDQELAQMMEEARHEVLYQMIEERLLVEEAKQKEIEVSEGEVDGKLARIRKNFATDQEFMDALAKEGLTLRDLRQKFREQIMVAKLVDREVRARINISPQDVSSYYQLHFAEFREPEKVRVKNILIRVEGDNEEYWTRARSQAEGLSNRLKEGSRFEDLAREYSQGSDADTGGDMGLIERGQMLAEIDEVIFDLKAGEVSEPVRTNLGYHVFKVEEKLAARQKEFSEAQDEIKEILFKERFESRYKEWVEKLKENAYISIK